MTPLDIHTHGDNCWPDLTDGDGQPAFITGRFAGIARLPNATGQGKSAVTIRIELPDGRTVLAQTTLALMDAALTAFRVVEQMEHVPKLVLHKGDLVYYRIVSGLFSLQTGICRIDKFERVPPPRTDLGQPVYRPGDILVSISPKTVNGFGPSMRMQPGEVEFLAVDNETTVFYLYLGRPDQIGSEVE